MKRSTRMTSAEKVVRRISELRDLARRLARAGYEAGLHSHNPNRLTSANRIAENSGKYGATARKSRNG